MEEDMLSPLEINSIAYLNKKRKPQAELLDTPLPKHVCLSQNEFSSGLTVEPKKAESLPESVSNSYSFPDDADSSMASCDDTKTSPAYPKTHASVGSSTSTTSWDNACSQVNGSTTKASSKSISDFGMLPFDNYEDPLQEYGDCEYQFDNCASVDLEDLLYSNGVDASNYVLSSGRWPVGQESQEKTKKLTIDKEFEEYFSMLML